jgi:hypothetical protein
VIGRAADAHHAAQSPTGDQIRVADSAYVGAAKADQSLRLAGRQHKLDLETVGCLEVDDRAEIAAAQAVFRQKSLPFDTIQTDPDASLLFENLRHLSFAELLHPISQWLGIPEGRARFQIVGHRVPLARAHSSRPSRRRAVRGQSMIAADGSRLAQVLARLGYVASTRGDDPERRIGPVLAMRMVRDGSGQCSGRGVTVGS